MRKIAFILTGIMISFSLHAQDFQKMRESMVNTQISSRGITHKPTLNAMRKVERHLFVPKHLQTRAYDDSPLPIGNEQTISQPYMVAFMTEAIDPKPGDKVLEIGAGSGYQAAVLAEIVEKVYTIEIVPELGNEAKERLSRLGYKNIDLVIGDGNRGLPDHAPFDAIIVTAAAEKVPPALSQQLKEGGKMIIPLGPQNAVQTLTLLEKIDGKIRTKKLMPVRFVPFTGD
jgi:protein-L-isoaspartate(D-aspartate) O-methyltransferase